MTAKFQQLWGQAFRPTRVAITFAAILLAIPLPAQRASSTTYDSSRRIRFEGAITRIDWVNPSAFLFIDVRDAGGTVVNWAVEFGSPLDLENAGYKSTNVHIGDVVRVDGVLARGERKQVFARAIVLTETGKRLFGPAPPRPLSKSSQPPPRWPDGQVRLGPAPGEKGYWGTASARVLVENGAKVPVNEDGLLLNLSDADRVAPFQPWALAVFAYRQRNLLRDDPVARCLPAGGPRQFQMPNGFQFIEQRELGRILVLLGGGDRNWRVIYTDGRPASQSAEAVQGYYGTSVGHWEKDTLVVDSTGYNERFWMTRGGLPHTEALHLTERFTRTDLDTLQYEVTVDDPRTYTRPWSGGWTIQWVPNKDMEEYFCEDNAESAFVR